MCRLSAITSSEYFSPIENVLALETMKEGHDGSGMGILMKDLGGEFEELKDYPVLSGICSESGLLALNNYMENQGFQLKHVWTPSIHNVIGIQRREHYFARVYQYPRSYLDGPMSRKGRSADEDAS